jgi:hypothetical protein
MTGKDAAPKARWCRKCFKWPISAWTILLFFSLSLNALLFVLFMWQDTLVKTPNCYEFNISKSFNETDLRYQSMDHNHDFLWDHSSSPKSGILELPDDTHQEGLERYGGIAMYA